jgi:dTDP-4-amino-4,6-dideoxygalactose transaminase
VLLINDLSAKIQQYQPQIRSAIDRVINSGWLVLGQEVKNFEASFAAYLGAQYCVSVANGTDAIELALKAMGVGSGDRVATAANAGMYSSTAILAIGAEPFFVDVDLESQGIPLSEVKRAVDAGVKAAVITHLFGLAIPDIEAIAQYCSQKGVLLLEDCAQVHGAKIKGQSAGTFGDAASFSFYPTKNLGALGDGGAVVANHAALAERIRSLRQYGWSSKYKVDMKGARNSRLDEMQAAILSTFLPDLDKANTRRREIATRYSDGIHHKAIKTPPKQGENYVAHLYVIRSQHRDSLKAHLSEQKIASDIHYPVPDYKQTIMKAQFKDISLKNTELLASEILTLPCYPEMSDAQVTQVIDAVNGWNI